MADHSLATGRAATTVADAMAVYPWVTRRATSTGVAHTCIESASDCLIILSDESEISL